MYQYDQYDQQFVDQRSAEFRHQVQRRLDGELSEDEFKPLRLQNGVYLQLHAYMLRVAIPYGELNSAQLRMLAHIARDYDKGFVIGPRDGSKHPFELQVNGWIQFRHHGFDRITRSP